MTNSRFIDRRKIKKTIPAKLTPLPGQLGNGNGQVLTNIANYVYCRIGGQVQIVFNSRVPPDNDTLVDVGYSYDASGKRGQYQVLGTRSPSPGGAGSSMQLGYPKAARYQLFAPDGGQDPIWLDKRQIINLLVWPDGSLTVRVYPGIVWSGDAYLYIGYQILDLSSYVPATAGKAVMVLITVSTSGSIVATAGDEFTLADVTDEDDMLSQVPAAPENTAEEIAAVRVYEGQSAIVVSRTVTDILDLRFISRTGDGGSGIPDAPSDGKQYGREDGAWTEIVSGGGGALDYVLLQEQKSGFVDNDGLTSGDWRTRPINTEVVDTNSLCSLSSNQITLQPGTYRCRIRVPGYYVNNHQARLYNVTDSSVTIVGSSEKAGREASTSTTSEIIGRFTIASAKTFEVQHRCTDTNSSNGMGVGVPWADIQVWAIAEFWKE